MMKLKKLFQDIPGAQIYGDKDVVVSGVSANSKFVSPGNLFIAKKGERYNGSDYIEEAKAAGCVAVLTDLFNPALEITQVIHPEPHTIESVVAATYYGYPSEKLRMFGLTGTNGKTTTSYILKHLIDPFLGPSGLLGTIEYIIGRHRYKPTHTTADGPANQKLLKEMLLQNCKVGIMEVTSHALGQKRVENIDYDVVIFTNLSQDHLDYHDTMENYAATKSLLFTNQKKEIPSKKFPRAVVANIEDPYYKTVVKDPQTTLWSYGIGGDFTVAASEIKYSRKNTLFQLTYAGNSYPVTCPLVGRFNVLNTLAALTACLTQGVEIEPLLEQLKTLKPIPGRLENVPNHKQLKIFVDFAHTEDALKNVLTSLNEVKKGRIITVFGCGGGRDKKKRPLMAKVVEDLSDFAFVTADNSRMEDPEEICRDIIAGFTSKDCYFVEVDRQEAIRKAVSIMHKNDILLIAGKGHETEQIFAHATVPFDDRAAVKIALEELR